MPEDTLSIAFAALADPTRRAILARLADGEATVTEIAEPFQMSLPAVSKHLKVLERAGLIERGRHAQWRPCRLRAEGLKEASDWLDEYRLFWEARMGRLGNFIKQVQQQEPQAPEELQAPQVHRTSREEDHHGQQDVR